MSKCPWCDVPIYVRVQCNMMPLLAPLTPVQELEYELINKTGRSYEQLPKQFCPACGRKLDGKEQK